MPLCCVLLLSACGFQPLYKAQNAAGVRDSCKNIEIANIPDRDGQFLRNALIDRLYTAGRPSDALYKLTVAPLEKRNIALGIKKDASSTRSFLQFTTHVTLTDNRSGKALLDRDMHVVGSYNILDNQYANTVSEQNVTENLLREMGDDILTELNVYFYSRLPS